MPQTPSRRPIDGPPANEPPDRAAGLTAGLLAALAVAALITLLAAAIPRPEPPPEPAVSALTSGPPATPIPEAPPRCRAAARPAAATAPDSDATPVWLLVECDAPGLLSVHPSPGHPAGAELDRDGRFEGALGRAYLCAGSRASLSITVTGTGGSWETTASLAAARGAPACDMLIRPGVTEFIWERDAIAVAVAFAETALGPPRGFGANGSPRATDHVVVWHRDESGRPFAWGLTRDAAEPLEFLERGKRYLIAADAEVAWHFPDPPAPPADPPPAAPADPPATAFADSPPAADSGVSVLDGAQVVSYYGHPGVPQMGILGAGAPEEAADGVTLLAARYDELNGDRDVIPALHLITGVAAADPGPDGLYLNNLSHDRVREWVRLAGERRQLIFLDVQVGWSDALTEVTALEEFLLEPHVHLALDPEFATLGLGPPGVVIGRIDAGTVDSVQSYLAGLVREHGLPPKLLVLHQFLDGMLPGAAAGYAEHPEVDVVIDMDGFGSAHVKLTTYRLYSLAPYAERPALKLFFLHDQPVMTPDEVQSLDVPPDLIIYQ